jgi:hypothetical protein
MTPIVAAPITPQILPQTPPTLPPETTPAIGESYCKIAQEKGIINDQGKLKRGPFTLNLKDCPQEIISQSLHTENLHTFLLSFVAHFAKFGKVEMRSGVPYIVGKEFWKVLLKQIVPAEIVDGAITEEMWRFCSLPPATYEICVILDQPHVSLLNEEMFKSFHQFACGLLGAQEVHPYIDISKPFSSLEIPLSTGSFVKIVWMTEKQPADAFHLEIGWQQEKLSYTLLSTPLSSQALHDLIVHRLDLTWKPHMVGKYVAMLTVGGPLFNQQEAETRALAIVPRCDLMVIFNEGKKWIPRGSEPLSTYWDNMVYFLEAHGIAPPSQLIRETNSLLGLAILQVVGALHARISTAPVQFFLNNGQLHISSTFHHLLPCDVDKALQQVEHALEKEPSRCLSLVSHVLEEFFTACSQVLEFMAEEKKEAVLLKLYSALRKEPKFYFAGLYLGLLITCKPPNDTDIVDVPQAIAAAQQENKLLFTQNAISVLMQLSPHAELGAQIVAADHETASRLLLLSADLSICSKAWELYPPDSKFLLSIAPTLDCQILPLALSRVRKQKESKVSEAFLERLMQEPALFLSYGPSLLNAYVNNKEYSRLFALRLLSYVMENKTSCLPELYPFLAVVCPTDEEAPHLVEKIRQVTTKLPEFLEFLKTTPHFLPDFVKLVCELAEQKEPPFHCFKKSLKKIEPSLNQEQKKLLALAYGKVIEKGIAKKQDKDLIQALPSLDWVFDNLHDHPDAYLSLFLALTPLPQATWLLENLQTPSSQFTQYLVTHKQKLLTPSWRAPLRQFIGRFFNTPETKQLLWKELLTPDEWNLCAKKAYDELLLCLRPPPPVSVHQKIDALLSGQDLSVSQLSETLNLLNTLPLPIDRLLWGKFGQQLIKCSTPQLMQKLWQTWLKNHPPSKAEPLTVLSWEFIITLASCCRQLSGDEVDNFLHHHALPLVALAPNPEPVITYCLKLGMNTFWPLNKKAAQEKISSLYHFLANKELRDKMRDPWKNLSPEEEVSLSLLLAQHPDEAIFTAGHTQFCLSQTTNEMRDNKPYVFKSYCAKPYSPRSAQQRMEQLTWVEENWALHQDSLSWNETYFLVEHLYVTHVDNKRDPAELIPIIEKWKKLTILFKKEQLQISLREQKNLNTSLLDLTYCFVKTLTDTHPEPLPLLNEIHNKIVPLLVGDDLSHFQLSFPLICIPKIAIVGQELSQLLQKIYTYVSSSKPDIADLMIFFIQYLPQILSDISDSEDDLECVKKIFFSMMKMDELTGIKQHPLLPWATVLQRLCLSMSSKHERLERFALETFTYCLSRDRGNQVSGMAVGRTAICFAAYFLSQAFQTLQPEHLRQAIQDMPEPQIGPMLLHLFNSPDVKRFRAPFNLSGARLFRYMNSSLAAKLAPIYLDDFSKMVLPFNPNSSHPLQFLIRTEWILAINSFPARLKKLYTPHKERLICELTSLAIQHITSETTLNSYTSFLRQITDREDMKIIANAFKFSPDHRFATRLEEFAKTL